MSKRVLAIVAVAVVVAAGAAWALQPERGLPENAPTEKEMATELGSALMDHIYVGHVPGRSGEVMLVPKPHHFLLGEWDLRTLGTANPLLSTSHPNPWDYLTRVPIIAAGGDIEPGRVIDREVDISDIAPSYARMLGMQGFDVDGEPLDEVTAGFPRPPKAIFTVVIDGGGWNALQEHPHSWPAIDDLRARGVTYTNATIASAPSITGALHATIGTGDLPLHHGIPGNQMRGPDGKNTDSYRQNADPSFLRSPTVGDVWDAENENKPIVGTVSYEGWHLGMIGRGAAYEGGDKDLAALWDVPEEETGEEGWFINEDFYELPGYIETDIPTLESYEERLDGRDGRTDGTWFGHTLEVLQDPKVRPGTPAFVRYTGDQVVEMINQEAWGEDNLTDLLYVEMKMPDYAGHAWNVEGAEQADVLLETDRQIARMRDALEEKVGRGNYLMLVTADHGQQPLPDLHGGWRINNKEIERDIRERFGDDILEKATPVDIYFDMDAVRERDVELSDVARYLGTYTVRDNIPENAPGLDGVPESRLDDTLFAGAFSTGFLQNLDDAAIEGFGEGSYPEGRIHDPEWTFK